MEIDAAPGSSADTHDEPAPAVDGGRMPRRSRSDRYLGGVAGGIGAHFDIDPFIIRAALLGSTLFAAYAANWVPVLPAAYTLMWLVMPNAAGRSALRTIRTDQGRRETVAAVSTFVVIALLLTRPVFGVALALAALAWVLLSDEPQPGDSTPEPTPPVARADAAQNLVAAVAVDDFDRSAGTSAAPGAASDASARASWGRRRRYERGEALVANFTRVPRRPRREPALWPLTLSLLAIIAVGGFMADALLQDGIDPAFVVNLALISVGAVIMVSAWRGRALPTVLLAVALLPAWIGFSVADVGRFDGSGTTTYAPTVFPASGTLAYENGYGSMLIDLRQLPLVDGDDLTLDIKATAGTVTVLAPPTAETRLRSKVGLGTTMVSGNGLSFYEYDREPHMDRTMVRRYEAHGSGCIPDYWASWSLVVENHTSAGVDIAGFDVADPEAVVPILASIGAAGFAEPTPIDDASQSGFGYQEAGDPAIILDEFGNQYVVVDGSVYPVGELNGRAQPVVPLESQRASDVRNQTWSYSADRNGLPCIATTASTNPAAIDINVTIGIGTLEVNRDEY